MIRVNVDGVSATVTEKEVLTAGRVGLECAFTFTGEWDGLFKTAVFQGVESVDVALPDNTCVVPWEAMAVEGVQLKVGVYGANGNGDIVIPTVWANFGKIQPSAYPSGNDPATPSQNANAYAVETAEQALAVAQSVETRANNGEFDGAPGADGFSPSASVSKAGDTTTITITDKDGTTTASINDGADGVDGSTLWTTTVEPAEPIGGGYEFMVSDLTGVSGGTPAAGDIIFYDSAYYPITSITGHSVLDWKAIADTKTSIRGATGPAPTDQQVQDAVDEYLDEHPVDEQVQDAVDEYLSNHPTVTGTFTNEAKNALLTLLEKVAYTVSNGQTYLDALRTELFRINVDSISAVFTQGSAVIYDTDSLDTLKQYLVVTATYSDSTTEVLPDSVYTLSGTLTAGTSTITVTYGGKTTTFDVSVVAYWDFEWDYTQGKFEEVNGTAVDSTGGTTTELTANAEVISVSANNYWQVYFPSAGSLVNVRTMANGYGVIEATFSAQINSGGMVRLSCAADTSRRALIFAYNGKFRIKDNSTNGSCTAIADYQNGTEYTLRIILKDTTVDVLLNGVPIQQDISSSLTITGSSNNLYLEGSANVTLKTFKVKSGGV